MTHKKSIAIIFISTSVMLCCTALFNYAIDPYDLYGTNYYSFKKVRMASKMRLIKALKISDLKPASIIIGTSRAEVGYDPNHKYFIKPSYNLSLPSSSMYENKLNFINALKQGNLQKVLFVADMSIFNAPKQTAENGQESYFNNSNIYKYLFSIGMLNDSILTVLGITDYYRPYLTNGQVAHDYDWERILKLGGHLACVKSDFNLTPEQVNIYTTNYTYKNSGKKSFPDFEDIVQLSYDNNIQLDIIFGPNHIIGWGDNYDSWLKFKKDIVVSASKIAKKNNKKQFRIMDFSAYHELTTEPFPINKNEKTKYYWEESHYKNALGLLVLNKLSGDDKINNFGIELNINNIDSYIENERKNSYKFINNIKFKERILHTREG